VELKSYAVAPRAPLGGNSGFRGFRLIRPRAPERPQRKAQTRPPAFSSAEMRHSFAIWSLDEETAYGRRLHLYYCLRCKWSFAVDDQPGLRDSSGSEWVSRPGGRSSRQTGEVQLRPLFCLQPLDRKTRALRRKSPRSRRFEHAWFHCFCRC
jgi:hypothetical protein